MRKINSDFFEYFGYSIPFNQGGFCWFDYIETDTKNLNIVIFTELRENTGSSITNSAEVLATKFLKTKVSNLGHNTLENITLLFVERYEDNPDKFDWVYFTYNENNMSYSNPVWKPASETETEFLKSVVSLPKNSKKNKLGDVSGWAKIAESEPFDLDW